MQNLHARQQSLKPGVFCSLMSFPQPFKRHSLHIKTVFCSFISFLQRSKTHSLQIKICLVSLGRLTNICSISLWALQRTNPSNPTLTRATHSVD